MRKILYAAVSSLLLTTSVTAWGNGAILKPQAAVETFRSECFNAFKGERQPRGWLAPGRTSGGGVYSLLRILLAQRYDVHVSGLNVVASKGNKKIVFVFEHPSLYNDPLILWSQIGRAFDAPVPVVAESQNVGVAKTVFKNMGALIVPDVTTRNGRAGDIVDSLGRKMIHALDQGKNIAFSGSGVVKRSAAEDFKNKLALPRLIQALPSDARVVIVTSKGLWGSILSYGATGSRGSALSALNGDVIKGLLTGTLPRRRVDLNFEEVPSDVLQRLRHKGAAEINSYFEQHINQTLQPNLFVPFVCGESSCVLPEPVPEHVRTDDEHVAITAASGAIPAEFKARFIDAVVAIFPQYEDVLRTAFAQPVTKETQSLGRLVGLDSIKFTDFLIELDAKLNIKTDTVVDGPLQEIMLAYYKGPAKPTRHDLRWFRWWQDPNPLNVPEGDTLLDVFYKKAKENPEAVWMSTVNPDGTTTVFTYREGVGKISAMIPVIKKMSGQRIGLVFPPSGGATLFTLATIAAGKTPVLFNFTSGDRVVKAGADELGVKTIVTSKLFIQKLREQAEPMIIDSVAERFVFTEDLVAKMTAPSIRNVPTLLRRETSRFTSLWPTAAHIKPEDHAVILFTSGSSKNPKAVALTHRNLLANIRDIAPRFNLKRSDAMVAFAPPFHSLGMTATVMMPAVSGLRVHYYPNAKDASGIAKQIEMTKATVLTGTPETLRQIFSAGTLEQFSTLNWVVAGAEKLHPHVADGIVKKLSPQAILLEGAGATETSPVWALMHPDYRESGWMVLIDAIAKHGDYDVVDNASLTAAIDTGDMSLIQPAPMDANGVRRGELVVSGDSVITSYLNGVSPESFFTRRGRSFYRTGDEHLLKFTTVDSDQKVAVKIVGRFTRSRKRGGEKIGFQELEFVLVPLPIFQNDDGNPAIYIGSGKVPGSTGEERTVLLTTKNVNMSDVNTVILKEKSSMWTVEEIFVVPTIPRLGTGKVNEQACNALIQKAMNEKYPLR